MSPFQKWGIGFFLATWIALGGQLGAAVTSLDGIQFWTGSGAQRAGFVVDWNGDSAADSSLAWGFRWKGSATGEDMLRAIIAADPRLFAKLGANGPLGVAVRGLGYDLNDDGQFGVDDETEFDADGVAASGPTDGAESVDPADRYREGWFTGVWNYGTANVNPWPGGAWSFSGVGATSRTLVDGAWDSWAFTNTFRQSAFAANASPAIQPADFDSDGDVDGGDVLAWQRSVGLVNGIVRNQGDANGDGFVGTADLTLWQTQFGDGAVVAATTAVPEPLCLITCTDLIFVLILSARHLRRRDS